MSMCLRRGSHNLPPHTPADGTANWPWRICADCGRRVWVGAVGYDVVPDQIAKLQEIDGWRVIDVSDEYLALDNRPIVEAAKVDGKSQPPLYTAVLPVALIEKLAREYGH